MEVKLCFKHEFVNMGHRHINTKLMGEKLALGHINKSKKGFLMYLLLWKESERNGEI